eukprot:scpid72539/ scgid8878/ 
MAKEVPSCSDKDLPQGLGVGGLIKLVVLIAEGYIILIAVYSCCQWNASNSLMKLLGTPKPVERLDRRISVMNALYGSPRLSSLIKLSVDLSPTVRKAVEMDLWSAACGNIFPLCPPQ